MNNSYLAKIVLNHFSVYGTICFEGLVLSSFPISDTGILGTEDESKSESESEEELELGKLSELLELPERIGVFIDID
jgi:hypothetical protein